MYNNAETEAESMDTDFMAKGRKTITSVRLEARDGNLGSVLRARLIRGAGRSTAALLGTANPFKQVICVGAATALLACTPVPPPNTLDASAQTEELPAAQAPSYISLKPKTVLASLAQQLDAVAVTRSSAIQEHRAAEAALRAGKFARYPQLTPTGTAPLNGDSEASLGLDQVIWDGGRIKSQLKKSELSVANAALRAWIERNDMVLVGLEAYVDMSRFQARRDILSTLQRDLGVLDARLLVRVEGGVADRGERLRMAVALQEVLRASISNESDLRQSKADLTRALNNALPPPKITNLKAAVSMCRRSWPAMEAPADALSLVQLRSAKADELQVAARRFPRLVLEAGMSTLVTPGIGLKLDAADMLGLGRKKSLEAANATTQAATVAHERQLDDTRADLARLEEDVAGFQMDVVKLEGLIATNKSTLKLFHEQLEAGSISITQGITIYQENAEAMLSMVDLQARLLANCLQSSSLRGALVPFGEDND